MITPQELEQEKQQRLTELLNRIFAQYKSDLLYSSPDENGYYRVSLPSLGCYTKEELAFVEIRIENALTHAGWEFLPVPGIFAYKIRSAIRS